MSIQYKQTLKPHKKMMKQPEKQKQEKISIKQIVATIKSTYQNFNINRQEAINIITSIPIAYVKTYSKFDKALLIIHQHIKLKNKDIQKSLHLGSWQVKFYSFLYLAYKQNQFSRFLINKYLKKMLQESTVPIKMLENVGQQLQKEQQYQKSNFIFQQQIFHSIDDQEVNKFIKQRVMKQTQSQCLGCIQYMEQEKPVPDYCQYNSIVRLNDSQQSIKKKTCSILNCGGGYIFVNNNPDSQLIRGYLLSNEQLAQYQQYYREIIQKSIEPKNYLIHIDWVRIKNNQQKRIIRLILRTGKDFCLYMVKKQVKNYLPTYNFFFLNLNYQQQYEDTCTIKHPQKLYDIMTYNIKNRLKQPRQLISQKYPCIGVDNKYRYLMNGAESSLQFVSSADQQPIIKYKNQGILIFSSSNQDKFIEKLKRNLELKKNNQFLFVKPYESCRNNSKKSMWFVTYQFQIGKLNASLNELFGNNKQKPVCIGCKKFISIQKPSKQFLLQNYLQAMKNKFKQPPQCYKIPLAQFSQQKLQEGYRFILRYKTYHEAVYSFLWLDNIRVRSQFLNQNQFMKITKNLDNYLIKQ